MRSGIITNKEIVWVSSRELPAQERELLVKRLSNHGATISISTAKDKSQLSQILERCRRAREKHEGGPILLVLDDMMSLTHQNTIFNSLQVEGRHYNIELVTTYQVVHQRRGNWNVSKGGARQLIITRLGAQAGAITNLVADYLGAHTAVSNRSSNIQNIARSLVKNEILDVPYGSILIVERNDKAFDCTNIRTNFYDNKRQFCIDITEDGSSYVKREATKVPGSKNIFKLTDTNNNVVQKTKNGPSQYRRYVGRRKRKIDFENSEIVRNDTISRENNDDDEYQ